MKPVSAPLSHTRRYFWLFALAHLLGWTLMNVLCRGNPPFDSVEGIAWGNQWQWGYNKHPLLAPWLTAAATNFAHQVDWPIYLLGALSSVICFWAIWRLATKILPPYQALISALLLEGIHYYNISAAQFNPNVLMLPLWALLCLNFYNALLQQRIRDWLLVGIFAGLAMLTKYESILLLAAIAFLLLITPQSRNSFKTVGFYLALGLFLLIITPNLIWLLQHDFVPFTYTATRLNSDNLKQLPAIFNHLYHPFLYFIEQLGAVLPTLVLFFAAFYRCPRENWHLSRFNYLYLAVIGAGPFLIVGTLSLLTGLWIHSLWAFPFFSLLGIILFAWRKPIITSHSLKVFSVFFIGWFCLILLARGTFLSFGPLVTHKTNSAHFPGQQISQEITQRWHDTYHRPLKYIAGYRTLVEHIVVYSPDNPTPYFDWDIQQSAWIDEADVKKQGAVFVWFTAQGQSILAPEVIKHFPNAIPQPVLVVRHLTKAPLPPIIIGVAYLPPS